MKVLQVIHGYPPRYNAGSEIYTQAVSQGLAREGHEVTVLSREEDPLRPDYEIRSSNDPSVPAVSLCTVNMPRSRERFRHTDLDAILAGLLRDFEPDVVHFGHLNHLSTGLVEEASKAGVPSVFTLHDFWLMCPRGQFIQAGVTHSDPWALCDGQEDLKCATFCYGSRYGSGLAESGASDVAYWQSWVGQRMAETRRVANMVGFFIAPSRTLKDRFEREFGVPSEKIVFLDYGFDLERFTHRHRAIEKEFTFGYIGTHRPAKGLQVLIDAAPYLSGSFRIRLWGRPTADVTLALSDRIARLPRETSQRIEWMGEYGTSTIVQDVFDRVDAMVVPSIWQENSPLVIHEAQQARVPVITANLGGMSEYVHDDVNGFLFAPRDPQSLGAAMQRMIDDPDRARTLGSRGYLYSDDGNIPELKGHVADLLRLYDLAKRGGSAIA